MRALNMGFGESAIAAVNWHTLEISGGRTADDLPAALLALFQSTTGAEAEQVWWKSFENEVFAQNTIYGAAEATVNVLMAALADERPQHVRGWILELLFFLLNADSAEDPTLAQRCRDQARQGLWLLAREARVSSGPAQEDALEALEIIDPQRAALVRDALASSH
jgi:hypothetical protein